MAIGNLISLSQATYPASTQYGAAVPVPAGAANGTAAAQMLDGDVLAGPPNRRSIPYGLQFSYDEARSWDTVSAGTFVSGPVNVVRGGAAAQPPNVTSTIPANPMPTHVRPYCSLPGPTLIGFTVSFADASGTLL